MEQKKAYIYSRVSTEMQVDGFSLDGQVEEMKAFCARNNIIIVDDYADKGKSGASVAKRDDFKRMLQDIELHKDNVDYVIVYKLSRFGRNLTDTINSLQVLEANGVALRTVDGAIDTSSTIGRLITTILAAVAEMELENIHEQTYLGRKEKAKEGKWNGGIAPFGYSISDGKTNEPDILVVNEDEAKIVRMIYDMFTEKRIGIAGIVTELATLGIQKTPRKNSSLTKITRKLVSDILENPVYCGKIAYGRRRLDKPDKDGTRKTVKSKSYILVEGKHQAIVSQEQYDEAQEIREKRAPMCKKREDNNHVHLLSTLIKCPVCGAKLYGNTSRKPKKNCTEMYKDYYFYACKHRLKVNGASCSFSTNINEEDVDNAVISILFKLVNDPHLAELLSTKLGHSVDKEEVEKSLASHKRQVATAEANIARLSNQLDHIDQSNPVEARKAADLEKRINKLYEELIEHEQHRDELYDRLFAINQDLLTKDAIVQILQNFTKMYSIMTPQDRQTLIRALVEEIQIYDTKQPDGRIIKKIRLSIPIVYENGDTPRISWDKNPTVESIVCLIK